VTLLPWIVLGALTAMMSLYVAAEFSAVAVQRSQLVRLARAGSRRASSLLAVLKDGVSLDRYIAACQIGITLSTLVAGAYAQATVAHDLAPMLVSLFGLEPEVALSTSAVIVLLALTALQVVLGELVPKSLALQFPERTALATYLPMRWSVSLYRGFIKLLNGNAALLLKPFGIEPGGHVHVHSPVEIQLLLNESRKGGTLSPEAHARLERGLLLSTRTVRQLMVPRGELVAIEASMPADDILRFVLESPYSRLPVYRKDLDHLIGTVSTKDVVALYASRGDIPPLEQLLRPIPFVPENLRADRLVRFLQERKSSKAIVVDEFGGVQGIVSIEDVLGELFGDIGDELKAPDAITEPLADGRVRLPGSMSLEEAEPWLGVRWDGHASTVGGHIVSRLGRLPAEGEHIEIDGVNLTVLDMTPTTVGRVLVHESRHSSSPARADSLTPHRAESLMPKSDRTG